jgi:hypothetical protein
MSVHRATCMSLVLGAAVAALVPDAAQAKRFAVACAGTVDMDERALGGFPRTATLKADQTFVIDEDARRVAHLLTGPPARLEDMCLSRDAACYSTFSDTLIVAETGRLAMGGAIGTQSFRYDRAANHVDLMIVMDRPDRRTLRMTYSMTCKPTGVPDLGY